MYSQNDQNDLLFNDAQKFMENFDLEYEYEQILPSGCCLLEVHELLASQATYFPNNGLENEAKL